MTYSRLQAAIELAVRLHRDQERDGTNPLPYCTHPIEVLSHLRNVGEVTDEDLLCVAALHDVLEETDIDSAEIAKSFSERVATLVKELTRKEPTPEETKGLDKSAVWKLRAEMLLEEIRHMSPDAQQVKLADRLSNVREAKRTKSGPKLERYFWQTEEILKIVPKSVNPGLWKAIKAELAR